MGQNTVWEQREQASEVHAAVLRVLRRDGPLRSAHAITGRVPYRRETAVAALKDLLADSSVMRTDDGGYVLPGRKRPSGLQVSYRKAVWEAAWLLVDETGMRWSDALARSTDRMARALSDRQRAKLNERSTHG